MAVPKKRVSKSRRDMRRYSVAYQMAPVAFTTSSAGEQVRTHTVTLETLGAYIEARNARKAAKKSSSVKA